MRNPEDLDWRVLAILFPASMIAAWLIFSSVLRGGVAVGPIVMPASRDLGFALACCTLTGPLMAYMWGKNPAGIIKPWERYGMGFCVLFLCGVSLLGAISTIINA